MTQQRYSRRASARPLRGTLGVIGDDFVRGVLAPVSYDIPARMLDRICVLSVGLCPALYNYQLYQAADLLYNASKPRSLYTCYDFWGTRK